MYLDGVRFAKDVFSNRYSELFSHVGAAKLGRSVREKIGQDIDGAGIFRSVLDKLDQLQATSS